MTSIAILQKESGNGSLVPRLLEGRGTGRALLRGYVADFDTHLQTANSAKIRQIYTKCRKALAPEVCSIPKMYKGIFRYCNHTVLFCRKRPRLDKLASLGRMKEYVLCHQD